jgi:lysozyme
MMKISEAGLELISSFEGLHLRAYLDPVGIPTIGWGHTGKGVHLGQTITKPQAVEFLRKDTSGAASEVNAFAKKPLTQPQFDALVSLVFNAGSAPLNGTLGRLLNQGDFAGAAAQFRRWVKGRQKNGQLVTFAGLVRRRAAEEAMFRHAAPAPDPERLLNHNEKDWVMRYDALVKAGKMGSPEAQELHEKMRRQRKTIWRLAQPAAKGGDGKGWHFRHRVERYRVLLARTT